MKKDFKHRKNRLNILPITYTNMWRLFFRLVAFVLSRTLTNMWCLCFQRLRICGVCTSNNFYEPVELVLLTSTNLWRLYFRHGGNFHYKGIYRRAAGRGILFRPQCIGMGIIFTSKVYQGGIFFTQKVYEWVKFEK